MKVLDFRVVQNTEGVVITDFAKSVAIGGSMLITDNHSSQD